MEWREYLRVLHWGPLLALGIITEITLSGLYCLLQWYPPSQPGGLIHLLIYLQWDVFILYNFFNAMYAGPGYVPDRWAPKEKADEKYLQYCTQCESFKAPRSHHCRKCGRCVMKMDHHCPWINNCVGHRNHHSFTLFVFFAPLGCLHAVCVLVPSMYRAINMHYYLTHRIRNVPYVRLSPTSFLASLFGVSLAIGVTIAVGVLFFIQRYYLLYGTGEEPLVSLGLETFLAGMFAVGLGIGVMLAVGALFIIQMKSILKNETGIETWIRDKAEYRDRGEDEEEEFTYPYDLGRWDNFKMVCHVRRRPELTGVWWPVIPECDQYTLTREQILQKREKKERSMEYRVARAYTGSILPVTMGPRVCCCPPCTDEPRVPVSPGDRVRVTRWKKHWLYGDKVLPDSEIKTKKRERGWFPRKCAVEPFEHAHHCDKRSESTEGHSQMIGSNGEQSGIAPGDSLPNSTQHEKTE